MSWYRVMHTYANQARFLSKQSSVCQEVVNGELQMRYLHYEILSCSDVHPFQSLILQVPTKHPEALELGVL